MIDLFCLWLFSACYEIFHKHNDQLSLKSAGISPQWISHFWFLESIDICTCCGVWRNSWKGQSCIQVPVPHLVWLYYLCQYQVNKRQAHSFCWNVGPSCWTSLWYNCYQNPRYRFLKPLPGFHLINRRLHVPICIAVFPENVCWLSSTMASVGI